MLLCAVMGISLVGCNVSTGGGGTKGETQMAESTEAGVEQEQQSTETATEEPSEATKNPEQSEGNQSGNPENGGGVKKYAPMTADEFNAVAAESVTTVTIDFGPQVKFYLDINFRILAVEGLEEDGIYILGKKTYVHMPMRFGEGLVDVLLKGYDLLIGGMGIERVILTVKTQLADMDALRSQYYQEIEDLDMKTGGLVAKISHRFSN